MDCKHATVDARYVTWLRCDDVQKPAKMKKTKASVRTMKRRKKTKKMPVQETFGAPKIFQKTIGLNVSPQLTRNIGYQYVIHISTMAIVSLTVF